jgi:NAD(P)-dependent dehydrogenase (short-subunit alcohol dehydrogenase family)
LIARFSDRAAIVTGGSSGIGRAIARRLAEDGADLVLVAAPQDHGALDEVAAELAATAGGVATMPADVGGPSTAERAVELALQHYGRLDLLASNAGIAYFEGALETPVEHLDRTYHVNVRGMFLMAMACARTMAAHGGGSIVCTASTASYMGEELQATYNASKGAVAALARSLAVDLAPHAIRVNAVAPGWVATPATQEIVRDARQWSKHRSRIPMDRPADPAEIAAVVAFLLSEEASYMTGSLVICDGGLTAGFRYSDWDAVEREITPRGPVSWELA